MEVIDLNDNIKEENEEVSSQLVLTEDNLEVVVKEKKLKKPKGDSVFVKFKKWFDDLSKKQRIIFFGCISLFIIILIVVLFFCFSKSDNENNTLEEEIVVLEMGNYKYINGVLYFYDSLDVELGSYECIVADEDLCALATSANDEKLDLVVSANEDESDFNYFMPIYENLVFIYDDEKVILYNMDSNEIVDEFSSVIVSYSDFVIVTNFESEYALLDLSSESLFVTEFSYDYIGYSKNGLNFTYTSNGKNGIMDSSGSSLSSAISNNIISYNDTLIVTESGGDYYITNYKNETTGNSFDFVKIYNEYAYGITNDLVYAYNSSSNKINEVGVSISSVTDYTEYDIYDNSGKLISSDRIVNVVKSNDKTILINDVSFNVYESYVSANLDYMNYINGVIYFYSDKSKNDLIGSYECEVPNVINSTTDSLSSCYIAKHTDLMDSSNSSGVIPLMYSRYAFIYDSKSLALYENIVLYDLSDNKSIANYSAIDLLSTTSFEKKLTFFNDSLMLVYAKNTEGKFGIMKLTKTGATGYISFDYESISLLSTYFVGTDSSGYNHLYDSSANLITTKDANISSEIVSYLNGYIIVNNSGKNQLLNASGQVISNAYEELFLQHSLYAAVTGDKIYVYSYNDKDTNLFSESIDYSFDSISFEETFSETAVLKTLDASGNVIESYTVSVG